MTDSGEIVTAFSYSNYCINSQHLPGNVRNRLQRKIPNLKRMRSYPALLIGRLGVDVRYHGLGLGSQTLDFIMRLYLHPDAGVCIESSVNETAGKPHIHLIHCGQLSVSDNNFIMLQQNIRLSGATVVVTGAAGFIGASLTRRLLDEYPDCRVIGIDNITDYYDVRLKHGRLERLRAYGDRFVFFRDSIADRSAVDRIFGEFRPSVVVNLAAQAGVRYSITNPDAYIESNIIGFYNILEACRHSYDGGRPGVGHLVYASSSSVYGANRKVPYSTDDMVDNPISLYAATKKSDELLAHAYSKLYDIPSTGLRFFTVYGPCGRPDMAYYSFTDRLVRGESIRIFNYGNCLRDFTYIDDIVEGVVRVMRHAPERRTGEDGLPIPPYMVYNIGNSSPESLLDFVTVLQEELVRAGVLPEDYDFEAHRELVPMQPGDVPVTYADTAPLERDFGFKPATPLRTGLRNFARWYKATYAQH